MKKKTAARHTNRTMNKDTYKLRRIVIDFIYEAKKLVPSLPRVDVRITDCTEGRVLGTARMNDKIIWIPAATLNESADMIRGVVFHELLHACYGVEHVKGCQLMSPIIHKTSKNTQNTLFLKHIKIGMVA